MVLGLEPIRPDSTCPTTTPGMDGMDDAFTMLCTKLKLVEKLRAAHI